MVIYIRTEFAEVVEWQTRRTQNPLRDDLVRVQVPPSAPYGNNTNSFSEFVLFFARDFFGLALTLNKWYLPKFATFAMISMQLTEVEKQTLDCYLNGMRQAEVCAELGIGRGTINHRKASIRKRYHSLFWCIAKADPKGSAFVKLYVLSSVGLAYRAVGAMDGIFSG